MDVPALDRQREELDEEWEALRRRVQALQEAPDVAGNEVRKLREAQYRSLRDEMHRCEQRYRLLTAQYEDTRLSRVIAWLRRVPWPVGALFGAVIPVSPAIPYALAGSGTVDIRFFEVAAQVIPVMVIVIAVERGLLRFGRGVPALVAYYVVYFMWIVVGEIAAFAVLASGNPTGLGFGLVLAALVGGGLLVVLQPLFEEDRVAGSPPVSA